MKPKIPTMKVQSDDCAINVGQVVEDGEIVHQGTPHYVHTGEWVEILPVITVKEVMQISKLQNAGDDASGLGENLTELCKELSKRVVKWNWTDLMGEPIDQPYNRPEILEGLSSEELMWLMAATSGGDAADARKKDSKESESISSEMDLSQPASA